MTVVQESKVAARSGFSRPRSAGPAVDHNGNDRRERVFTRLSKDEKQRAEYWADRRDYDSVNDYIAEAVAEKIERENLDFDIPDILTARINQVVDELKALSTNNANLERVVTMGFDSLLGLTRGDNYLLDEENGELT
ncbi:hypothetical protein [uncultured Arthrobacter sp.]|uniref:hypothetical protein n=1 Tax=uncultured Arthrobacter sp. TaxID=114050 RepID=UPI0028D316B8|nr:hypothetical protein [uncultured Arthrobacter sp.]